MAVYRLHLVIITSTIATVETNDDGSPGIALKYVRPQTAVDLYCPDTAERDVASQLGKVVGLQLMKAVVRQMEADAGEVETPEVSATMRNPGDLQ